MQLCSKEVHKLVAGRNLRIFLACKNNIKFVGQVISGLQM